MNLQIRIEIPADGMHAHERHVQTITDPRIVGVVLETILEAENLIRLEEAQAAERAEDLDTLSGKEFPPNRQG